MNHTKEETQEEIAKTSIDKSAVIIRLRLAMMMVFIRLV